MATPRTSNADLTRLRNRLRRWRTEVGLSLEEVADLTGVSVAFLSRLERGQRDARPLLKARIARRLGVPIRELFDVEPVEEDGVV